MRLAACGPMRKTLKTHASTFPSLAGLFLSSGGHRIFPFISALSEKARLATSAPLSDLEREGMREPDLLTLTSSPSLATRLRLSAAFALDRRFIPFAIPTRGLPSSFAANSCLMDSRLQGKYSLGFGEENR